MAILIEEARTGQANPALDGRPPAAPMTPKQARQHTAMQRRKVAEQVRQQRDEEAAEKIAPRAQRKSQVRVSMQNADGETVTRYLPGGRLSAERTSLGNVRVTRTNVVANLHARQAKRIAAGKKPMITEEHVKAAAKLAADFDEVGTGIGLGASDYLNKSAGRTAPGSGVSAAKHAAIMEQLSTRARLEAALTYVGGQVDIIVPVVLQGVDVSAWAEARGFSADQSVGYLAAALDRLAEFYAGGKPVGIVFMKPGPGDKSRS